MTGDAEHTICFDDHPRLEMEALRAIATGRAVVAPSTLALTLTPERSVVPAHDRSARIAAAGYLASAAAEAHAIAHAARAEVDQHHGWAARWGTRDTPAVTPRVAVIGYYGARNAGDELILESLVTHLRARVRVVAYRPEHVPASHGLPSTRLGSPEATGTIVQSDALLIGGGGLLQDYLFRDAAGWARARHAPRGLPAFLRHAIEARTAGKHVALWSIGVGPVEGRYGKVLTRLLAETATLVTVREAASVVTLRDCDYSGPVEVVNDPTTLLPLADAVPVDRIAVALRSFPGTPDAFIPQLADGLDRIIERTALPVAFVGFQRDPADDEIHAAVRARMRHADRATILGLDDPRDIHRAVATSRLVIGMRLHASILANAAGIPSVGLAYDPKVRAHYDETGQGDACLALDASPDLLADAVERALRADPRARADAHRAAAAAATRGFDRLHALLAGPAPAAFDPDPIARALDALET